MYIVFSSIIYFTLSTTLVFYSDELSGNNKVSQKKIKEWADKNVKSNSKYIFKYQEQEISQEGD